MRPSVGIGAVGLEKKSEGCGLLPKCGTFLAPELKVGTGLAVSGLFVALPNRFLFTGVRSVYLW